MTRSYFAPLSACLLLAIAAAPAPSQEVRTERIQFKRGTSSALIEGSIKGYETVDYLVGAREGQYINVSLATQHTATYFNILAPGSADGALFNSSISENQVEGTLPATGDYRIRVYMMRAAARRNEVARYRLEVIVTGGDAPGSGHDATVPGTGYHATGTVPCSGGHGQPTAQCPFGVVRKAPAGTADVTVTLPDGRTRIIFFRKGLAVGSDAGEAGGQGFTATRESDLNIVKVGTERFEIPDAVVGGG